MKCIYVLKKRLERYDQTKFIIQIRKDGGYKPVRPNRMKKYIGKKLLTVLNYCT